VEVDLLLLEGLPQAERAGTRTPEALLRQQRREEKVRALSMSPLSLGAWALK